MENGNHLIILLVSDDVSVANDVRRELVYTVRIRDHHVKLCKSLDESLEWLKNDELQPDIIILDLGLIGVEDPKEVFQKIEGVDHRTPIIALTGHEESEHNLAIFVMEAGASDVMIRGQFGRLADAIQFALIRSKIARGVSDKSAERLMAKDQVISWLGGSYSVEK